MNSACCCQHSLGSCRRWASDTYRWRHEFGDFVVDFPKSLLGILKFGKDSGEECFGSIHIMLCRVVAIHAMFVIRVALNVEYVPLLQIISDCIYSNNWTRESHTGAQGSYIDPS